MMPNIHDGDRLIVDRISYAVGDVQRFDVVILAYPKDPSVDYVKRIVGLPGDEVSFEKGRLSVNGKILPEGFQPVPDFGLTGRWRVPTGNYFVLGDNRPVSSDSREGWFVEEGLLRGKVQYCFWPITHARSFH